MPVHFLDLASATEKLRWAEKEWRELEREAAARSAESDVVVEEADELDAETLIEVGHVDVSRR